MLNVVAHEPRRTGRRLRRLLPSAMALAVVCAVAFGTYAFSEPVDGVRVPSTAEFNALDRRVTELEVQVSQLATPSPTTETPTGTPTGTPTETPTETPTGGGLPRAEDFPTPQTVGPTTEPTTTYSGGCLVTNDNAVIENVVVNCQLTGLIIAKSVENVVIRNAVVNGGVFTSFTAFDPESEDDSHPLVFRVVSSRILAGTGPTNDRAVGSAHFVVRDSYLGGVRSGLWAHNDVVIEDSYITTDGTHSHQSGLRMLKNSTLRGNTIYCNPFAGSTSNDTSGCSGSAVFYREFGVPANLTIEGNYFPYDASRGGGYFATRFIDCDAHDDCVNIKMVGNLFDRGQGTDGGEFPNDEGDVWSDNWWTDGAPALSGQSR